MVLKNSPGSSKSNRVKHNGLCYTHFEVVMPTITFHWCGTVMVLLEASIEGGIYQTYNYCMLVFACA